MHPWPNDGSRYAELRDRKHMSFSMEHTASWLHILSLLHSPVRDTHCTQALWFTRKTMCGDRTRDRENSALGFGRTRPAGCR